MSDLVDIPSLLTVLVVSLAAGAGLVAAFATALYGMSRADGGKRATGWTIAGFSGALVLSGVGLGLYVLVTA